MARFVQADLYMSTRFNNGSHYENHQRAAELEKIGTHAHSAAEENGKQDHLTGPEQSRLEHEHVQGTSGQSHAPTVGHGIIAFGHREIEALAHSLWEARAVRKARRK